MLSVLEQYINFKLKQKKIRPPYNSTVHSYRDLQHFDQQFTNEPPTLTEDTAVIEKIDQSQFEGFDYCTRNAALITGCF